MRELVLHIAFLSLLLSGTVSRAFALVNENTAQTDMQKALIECVGKAKHTAHDSSLFKNDVINDVEEFEEFDLDEHDTCLGGRFFAAPIPENKSDLLSADFNSKTIGNSIYTHLNLSRIPRYNYITLRVFRI